jgi:hypothetical protein
METCRLGMLQYHSFDGEGEDGNPTREVVEEVKFK